MKIVERESSKAHGKYSVIYPYVEQDQEPPRGTACIKVHGDGTIEFDASMGLPIYSADPAEQLARAILKAVEIARGVKE